MPARAPRITIRDVARTAGVSVTTVSDSLNGKGRLEAATRLRVSAAAQQLGYRADRRARGLRSGRTMTVGLALPGAAARPRDEELAGIDYYMELAAAAASAAFARDHALLLLPPVSAADELRALAVDGVIVVDPRTRDPLLGRLRSLRLPAVTVDREIGRPDDPWWVAGDNAGNARRVLDHLAAAGARRVGLLTARAPWSWFHDTGRAYRDWAAERGQDPLIAEARLRALEPSAAAAAGRLLDRPDRPDAIFAPPDRCAAGTIRAARARGLRVPGDLLVASGVDSHQMRAAEPPITALDLRPAAVGAAAVDLLIARIEGAVAAGPRVVPAELHVRGSTSRSAGEGLPARPAERGDVGLGHGRAP